MDAAIKWLKGMNGKKTCIQYKQKDWDIIMGNSISNGEILIIVKIKSTLLSII